MASHLDPFKMLRAADNMEEYDTVVEILMQGLWLEDPLGLLPLLKGTLAEVIRRQDEEIHRAKAKAKKTSAFGQFTGPDAATAAKEEEEEANGPRRWQQLLRAVFNAEAACALLDEVLDGYRGEEFQLAARDMNLRWRAYDSYGDQMEQVDALCLKVVLGPVLRRYGFPWDEKGNQDISTIVAMLATANAEVASRLSQVEKVIFPGFTNLGLATAQAGEGTVTRGGLTGVTRSLAHLDHGVSASPQLSRRLQNIDAIARAAAVEDGYLSQRGAKATTKSEVGSLRFKPAAFSGPAFSGREAFPDDSD